MSEHGITGVLMAAGMGRRLLPLTADRPKALVEISGIPLIDFGVAFCRAAGASSLAVLGGFQFEKLSTRVRQIAPEARLIENPDYELQNGVSLKRLLSEVTGNLLVCDIDYLRTKAQAAIAGKMYPEVTLFVSLGQVADPDVMRVGLDAAGNVHTMAKTLAEYQATSAGMFFVPVHRVGALQAAADEAIAVKGAKDARLEDALLMLVASGVPVQVQDVGPRTWAEVDTPEEKIEAEKFLGQNRSMLAAPEISVTSKTGKTFFFAMERGLVMRNILRTGILEQVLAPEGNRVVVLLPRRPGGIPQYLREEFAHPRISLEEVPERDDSFLLTRVWLPVINNLVYTDFTDMLAREGSGKVKPVPKWWYPVHRRLFGWLSKRPSLKWLVRWLDGVIFQSKGFGPLFEKYKPDVVFCGSIISKYDISVLKAAKRHGVLTVGMQKGWDNLQKQLIRHVPDVFLLQNKVMLEPARSIQAIAESTLKLVGFPQFDNYIRKADLPTRTAFFAERGLAPETKVIFFGSEGLWTRQDDQRFDELVAWQREGKFPFPTYLIARPHFSDIRTKRFDRFKGMPGVFVDDGYRCGTYFADTWDPSREDMRHFESELQHADVLVSYASTLSLDAACFDLPVVSIGYGSMLMPDGRDLTMNLYKADHYLPVVESGAAELVRTSEELFQAIVASVQDRSIRADGRKRLRETMCGILDGHSAERVATQLLKLSQTV